MNTLVKVYVITASGVTHEWVEVSVNRDDVPKELLTLECEVDSDGIYLISPEATPFSRIAEYDGMASCPVKLSTLVNIYVKTALKEK